jgi:hypothetical protein
VILDVKIKADVEKIANLPRNLYAEMERALQEPVGPLNA